MPEKRGRSRGRTNENTKNNGHLFPSINLNGCSSHNSTTLWRQNEETERRTEMRNTSGEEATKSGGACEVDLAVRPRGGSTGNG